MNEATILKREDRLLPLKKRYILLRALFTMLAALLFIGFLNLIFTYEGERNVTEYATTAFWGGLFFIFVAYYCHSRVMHIESIKYYREKILAHNPLENRRA